MGKDIKMEKDISVIFDHIHGNIAMVRYIDVDFSITKGYLIKEKNMQDLLNLIENQKPNLSIDLPQNKIARKSYDKIFLIC